MHDITTMKRLGFTMLRKHLKVEPLRWYAHCDRLGMLVWQDMVNGGERYRTAAVTWPGRMPIRLRDDRYALLGRADPAGREEFRAEVRETVEHLRNVTSLAVWVPFNEGWGQFDAVAVAAEVRALDPTRSVDHASGWHDQGAGDLWSLHLYGRRVPVPAAAAGRAKGAGADGVRRLRPDRRRPHLGPRALRLPALRLGALPRRGVPPAARRRARARRAGRPSATVYTQLSDVEDEVNGLLTYDREVHKLPDHLVREVLARLYAGFRRVTQ